MAKGFAPNFNSLFFLGALALILLSCSKKEETSDFSNNRTPQVETFAIESSKLVNCHFKNPVPTYTYKSPIEANPIICEEGVPRNVQLLSPNPLPNGIEFSDAQLSLAGVAEERMVNAPYQFYIENEAGYAMIKIAITVK